MEDEPVYNFETHILIKLLVTGIWLAILYFTIFHGPLKSGKVSYETFLASEVLLNIVFAAMTAFVLGTNIRIDKDKFYGYFFGFLLWDNLRSQIRKVQHSIGYRGMSVIRIDFIKNGQERSITVFPLGRSKLFIDTMNNEGLL